MENQFLKDEQCGTLSQLGFKVDLLARPYLDHYMIQYLKYLGRNHMSAQITFSKIFWNLLSKNQMGCTYLKRKGL